MSEKHIPGIDDLFQEGYTETERKLLPYDREKIIDKFRHNLTRITQLQLSYPTEPYNLRMRKETIEGSSTYRADLKNSGVMTPDGLKRLEVPGLITKELFEQYDNNVPVVKKWRAKPHKDIVVDFFDDGYIHVESENPVEWEKFKTENELHESDFRDITGHRLADNEWRAHNTYRIQNGGREAFVPRPGPDVDHVVGEIHAWRSVHDAKPFVQISGRSGSGKTTFANKVKQRLAEQEQPLRSVIISIDEYNRGMSFLKNLGGGKWEDFDADIVWDTMEFRGDMEKLRGGEPIPLWHFDYSCDERKLLGTIDPKDYDVFIIEGVKAHHPDLHNLPDLAYEISTPLATSLGRRIMRDMRERPLFANPSKNLVYYLTYAEPAYSRLYKS